MASLVSGGFAIVQPGSQLSINAVEGFPLDDFSADVSSVRTMLCSLVIQSDAGHRLFGHKSRRRRRSPEVAEASRTSQRQK